MTLLPPQSTSSLETPSERIRLGQIARKVPILERHIRRAEISVGQRRARSSRKTLPSNERLLPTSRARETKSAQAKGKTLAKRVPLPLLSSPRRRKQLTDD
jgi:hypothetical protein